MPTLAAGHARKRVGPFTASHQVSFHDLVAPVVRLTTNTKFRRGTWTIPRTWDTIKKQHATIDHAWSRVRWILRLHLYLILCYFMSNIFVLRLSFDLTTHYSPCYLNIIFAEPLFDKVGAKSEISYTNVNTCNFSERFGSAHAS